MRKLAVVTAAAALSCSVLPPFRFLPDLDRNQKFHYEIGLSQMTLPNGLRVLLAPAKGTNLVAVNMRYEVGSSSDPAGRTGLAHFVEHATFLEHEAADRTTLDERILSLTVTHNAQTGFDSTDYYEVALADRLPDVLDVEAARMAGTCATIDDTLLARERGVVANEIAWRRSPLYEAALAGLFDPGSPYGHAPGGSDLTAIQRADLCTFLDDNYAPDHAILVVSGAFDPDQAARAISARFARLPRHGHGHNPAATGLAHAGAAARTITADVDHPVVVLGYPAAPWGSEAAIYDGLLVRMMQGRVDGLVGDHKDLAGAEVTTIAGPHGGAIVVAARAHDGADLDAIERKVAATLAEPMGNETHYEHELMDMLLKDLRAVAYQTPVRSFEDLLERGPMLADYLQYTDRTDFHLHDLEVIRSFTDSKLADYYDRRVAHAQAARVHVEPSSASKRVAAVIATPPIAPSDLPPSRLAVDEDEADGPMHVPDAAAGVEATDDVITLGNGLRVVFAPQPGSSMFSARMIFPVGSGDDPDDRPGLAVAAADRLEIDMRRRFDDDQYDQLMASDAVGTLAGHDVDFDHTAFRVSGLGAWARWHLWNLHLSLESGGYRDRPSQEAKLDDDARDQQTVTRALLSRLFGADHPYARTAHARAFDADELEKFKRDRYVTGGATLVISGSFDRAAIERDVRTLWGEWPRRSPPARRAAVPARPMEGPSVLAREDGSLAQVHIVVAFAVHSNATKDLAVRRVAERMLEDRLGALREELAATYSVDVSYTHTPAGDLLTILTDVDAARTAEVLARLDAELARLADHAGELRADFVRARRAAVAAALVRTGSTTEAADQLEAIAALALPLDFYAQVPSQIGAVTPAQVAALLHGDLVRAHRVVMITGPHAKALADAANLGTVSELPRVRR